MQFTISVDIPKRNRGVFMLAKTIAVSEMKVPLALLVTHASTLVAGKSLVNDESVYKGRATMRSFFFFITHCLEQFTKTSYITLDGVTKISVTICDDCGLARRSQKTWKT